MTEITTRPSDEDNPTLDFMDDWTPTQQKFNITVSRSGQQSIILGWRDLAFIEMKFSAAWDYLDEHGLMNDELSDLFKAATAHITMLMDHTTEPPIIVALATSYTGDLAR